MRITVLRAETATMQHYPRIKHYIIMALVILLLVAMMSTTSAFAASRAKKQAQSAADLGSAMTEAFGIIRTIGIAGGAAGIAYCGLRYMMGNAQESSKALRIAFYIALAIIALLILPSVFQIGAQIGQRYAWSPPGS